VNRNEHIILAGYGVESLPLLKNVIGIPFIIMSEVKHVEGQLHTIALLCVHFIHVL
jgi:hypothetical protein